MYECGQSWYMRTIGFYFFSMPLLPWQQSRDHLNGLHPNDQNKVAAASGYSLK
jgi:hypothetical protein